MSATVADDLRRTAARVPERTAVVDRDTRLTYAALLERAEEIAAGLAARGVETGDRVALVLSNSAEAAAAFYGAVLAGAVVVPINPAVKEGKRAWVIEDTGARTAVTAEEELAALRGGATPDGPDPDGLAAIVYTSGSTGRPKGVMVSHRTMTFLTGSIVDYLAMTEEDRVLSVLPLAFGYGLYQLITCTRVGATLVLERGITFPGRVVEVLEREEITALPGVPTVFGVLTSLQGLAERELPHLRTVTNAGAALPEALVRTVRRTFPRARLFLMYGQTEAQRICYLPPGHVDERPTCVGVPIPGTELWIEHEDGSVAAPGEVGQLVVCGPHVMVGYWRDEESTQAKLRPGRTPDERILLTGDLFRADDDGLVNFVGRTDDIIKCRGEKVAPREVEEVLHHAPGVTEASVVGVDDPVLGQAVHAHVAGSGLDPRALRRHCAAHLEDVAVPGRIVVHDVLPRTPNGKIDRQALVATPGP